MYKYDGRLIHQSHDDDGIIEVVELNGVRSLHFGSYPRQSSMRIAAPDRLQLAYVRAMTSWLLFKQTLADEALIVGLGGGSLTKHLLHHFPDCRLRVVEYRKSVVRIARSHFGLPLDPRLKIIVDDGGHYILQRTETEREQYSLLFVDAFDHEGMAESICNETFFQACKPLLKKNGILVMNLWGTDKALFTKVARWLGRAFQWRILFLPVRCKGNIIAFAFNDDSTLYSMRALRTRASALEEHYQIEFPVFLRDLNTHNTSTLNNLIKP
jgi:spermidine synthase